MQKLSRQILIEFLWLTFSLAFTLLLAIFLFGWAYLKSQFGYWFPLILLFFVVTFIIYSVREFSKNYRTSPLLSSES